MCELLESEQPARSEVRQKLSAMSHKMEQLLGICEELGDKYQYEGEVDKMAALQVEMDDIDFRKKKLSPENICLPRAVGPF